MSHTTPKLQTQPAPWSAKFQDYLSKMPSPEFVFGTLHPTPPTPNPQSQHQHQHQAAAAPTPYVPRLRYCIYRGMWATLPENKHNTAPRNPEIYSSDMPTFTTDVRMEKNADLFLSSEGGVKIAADPETGSEGGKADVGKEEKEKRMSGSGGGGAVEAVWWIKDIGIQWRVKGRGYVVGPDIDWEGRQSGKASSGVRTVKGALGERMRLLKPSGPSEGEEKGTEEDWSWSRELTAHFGNCSPGMRGTWRNPTPGTPTKGEDAPAGRELGQKVEDLEDEVARGNFRVVVIRPEEVEMLDLSDPATARRWRYTFVVEKGEEGGQEARGEWRVEELWP